MIEMVFNQDILYEIFSFVGFDQEYRLVCKDVDIILPIVKRE